uniref:Uncharacterized protein n=1 Tax=Rhizophagus irregularis (strain DAOM 181602 / DAOM 197198 / MUCL 43194) TaxID=747089 RepID=U9SUM0_RHIID
MPKLPKLFRCFGVVTRLLGRTGLWNNVTGLLGRTRTLEFLDSLDEPRLQSVTGLLGRTWTLECFQTPWTNLDFRM